MSITIVWQLTFFPFLLVVDFFAALFIEYINIKKSKHGNIRAGISMMYPGCCVTSE